MPAQPNTSERILILGCGVFGVSTALHFLKAGYKDVLIIDKSDVLPAVDAASTDLNKIVRAGDYADSELARLSVLAVEEWKKAEWEGCYHETGILMTMKHADTVDSFTAGCRKNLPELGINPVDLPTPSSIVSHFPPHLRPYLGSFNGKQGYFNPVGGWVEAARAVEVAMKMVRQLGGKIEGGKGVKDLLVKDGKCSGVILSNDEVMDGYDLVVVALGAWTPSVMPQHVASTCTATGQVVAKTQLDKQEEQVYSSFPVILDMEDGSYVFPPNHQGIVKSAIHGGWLNYEDYSPTVSVPRTINTPGAHEGFIPREEVANLRQGLSKIFPKLGAKDYMGTRLCWYNDGPTGEWLIDAPPNISNVLFACRDSGHGFKFLPTLGAFVLQRYLGTLPPSLAVKFSFASTATDEGADHRPENTEWKVLEVDKLATRLDLVAPTLAKL